MCLVWQRAEIKKRFGPARWDGSSLIFSAHSLLSRHVVPSAPRYRMVVMSVTALCATFGNW